MISEEYKQLQTKDDNKLRNTDRGRAMYEGPPVVASWGEAVIQLDHRLVEIEAGLAIQDGPLSLEDQDGLAAQLKSLIDTHIAPFTKDISKGDQEYFYAKIQKVFKQLVNDLSLESQKNNSTNPQYAKTLKTTSLIFNQLKTAFSEAMTKEDLAHFAWLDQISVVSEELPEPDLGNVGIGRMDEGFVEEEGEDALAKATQARQRYYETDFVAPSAADLFKPTDIAPTVDNWQDAVSQAEAALTDLQAEWPENSEDLSMIEQHQLAHALENITENYLKPFLAQIPAERLNLLYSQISGLLYRLVDTFDKEWDEPKPVGNVSDYLNKIRASIMIFSQFGDIFPDAFAKEAVELKRSVLEKLIRYVILNDEIHDQLEPGAEKNELIQLYDYILSQLESLADWMGLQYVSTHIESVKGDFRRRYESELRAFRDGGEKQRAAQEVSESDVRAMVKERTNGMLKELAEQPNVLAEPRFLDRIEGMVKQIEFIALDEYSEETIADAQFLIEKVSLVLYRYLERFVLEEKVEETFDNYQAHFVKAVALYQRLIGSGVDHGYLQAYLGMDWLKPILQQIDPSKDQEVLFNQIQLKAALVEAYKDFKGRKSQENVLSYYLQELRGKLSQPEYAADNVYFSGKYLDKDSKYEPWQKLLQIGVYNEIFSRIDDPTLSERFNRELRNAEGRKVLADLLYKKLVKVVKDKLERDDTFELFELIQETMNDVFYKKVKGEVVPRTEFPTPTRLPFSAAFSNVRTYLTGEKYS
jgi:hypothetical protein